MRHGEETRPLAPHQTGGWGGALAFNFSQRLANLEVRLDWLQILSEDGDECVRK